MNTKRFHVDAGVADNGLRLFFLYTFWIMACGLAVTALVAYYIQSNETLFSSLTYITESTNSDGELQKHFNASGLWWCATLLELGIVLYLATFGSTSRISLGTALVVFAIYSGLNGLTLAPILYMYTEASVAKVFMITAFTFGSSALWGHTTKRNLLSLHGFIIQALLGIIVVMIVSWFFSSPMMDMLISIAAVLLFIVITAFDMQKLKAMYEKQGWSGGLAVYGALSLYLDFINLLLHLLRLFGNLKK